MKHLNILGLSLLAIGFSACQVKIEEIGSVAPEPPASIDGIWSTACIADSNDSYIRSFEVKDDVMTMATLRYFNDRYCNQANLGATIMQSGSITVSGDSSDVTGGKNYEWQISVAAVVPNNVDIATMLNNDSACGSNSWALGQAGSVFGCAIGSDFDMSQVAFNTVHYGVFDIEGAATPNYLQFESVCEIAGYEELCPTPADRPATLGGTTYFKN